MEFNYSAKAKKAASVFFKKWNDLDIYIEDCELSTQKIYIELINRITDGNLRISRLLPLGGKKHVIDACHQYTMDNNTRKSIFIIDGDLGLILKEDLSDYDNLFVHDCYCVENYIVDKTAAVEIMYEEDATKTREEIESFLDFDGSFQKEANILLELFIVFALMHKYQPDKKTVSLGLTNFTTGGKNPSLDISAINKFITETHQALYDLIGQENIIKEKICLYESVGESTSACFKYVSGKDFLFPLLTRRMREIVSIKASRHSFKIRMAKLCNIDRLIPFRDFICSVASA